MALKCTTDLREELTGFRDNRMKWFAENAINNIDDDYDRKYRNIRRLYDRDEISSFDFAELISDIEHTAKRRCAALAEKIKDMRKYKYVG